MPRGEIPASIAIAGNSAVQARDVGKAKSYQFENPEFSASC